jgi:glycosyltransferase involved in cell wall biosynthesis
MESMMFDIVLLSTADWDNPFWTNKQHVACELARTGHRVLYVESLGLRRPSTSAQDMGRLWRRLKRGLKRPREVRPNLWVWSPLVVPLQRFALVRGLNQLLVRGGLKLWSMVLGLKPTLLWTYNPMTVRFVKLASYPHTVYHCVDEIKAQPGMPVQEIERAEGELMAQVGLCFVTAEYLLETRRLQNPRTYYFPNVAEFDHIAAARTDALPVPADLAALPGPRIGFVGAISGYKVDFPLLRRMAETHPEWSIVLIGKVGEGDPWTDVSSLQDLKNLHFVGPRSYADLPAYLKGFDVAILPSMINEYTRGMFPMKFFEYLAAGRPVVSTHLHALKAYGHVACLADDHGAFIAGVEQALAGHVAPLEARLDAARDQTYERRTARMMALLAQPQASATVAAVR